MSIKNPEALHGLGKQRFKDVPAIANSETLNEMLAVMWSIEDSEPVTPEAKDVQLRVITYQTEHGIRRPRRRYAR